MVAILFLKRNSRKGGANLRVCHESRQGFATFSEISFEKQSKRAAENCHKPSLRSRRKMGVPKSSYIVSQKKFSKWWGKPAGLPRISAEIRHHFENFF